jgi:hypothetical protein
MDSNRLFYSLFLSILLLSSIVSSHICIIDPIQRVNTTLAPAGFSVANPGESACYNKVGPCGVNSWLDGVLTKIPANSFYDITFQQNLNHYFVNQPGNTK